MDLLKKGLKKVTKPDSYVETDFRIQQDHFKECYYAWKEDKSVLNDPTYKFIPRFYRPALNEDDESLPAKLREEALSLFLQKKGQSLMDNSQLRGLCPLLEKHNNPPTNGDDLMINYKNLKLAISKASPKCREYFTPTLFAQLQQNDIYNRVSVISLLNYAMRKSWLQQSRIGLSLYDVTGKGYLKESDLEKYILELMPTLPQLDDLGKSFHSFYVCTAVRKFLFFLDPMRTGKIRVQDILACSFLDDLLELRDEDMRKDHQESNWFSAPSALRVYGQYLNLDTNRNGMLNKKELSRLGTGTLTNVFVERVFQECLTYEGEMDYKTYLDFILALENRHEPQALQYLFRILDVNGKGYLDTFSLNYFFRAIQEQMRQNGQDPVSFDDVRDEMFDMIKPVHPSRITLQDLLNSGHGETLVNILIDLNGFWTHENRGARAADEPSDL